MSLGIAQLMLGDFEDGWYYEARWQAISFTAKRRSFAGTPWTGQPLTGKSILVYAMAWFRRHDTIRTLFLIAGEADKVVFECQKALMQLCSNLDGVTQLVARGEPLPETDYHVPLASLPHRTAETVGHVPIVTRYLRVRAAAEFRQRRQTGKPLSALYGAVIRIARTTGCACPPALMRPSSTSAITNSSVCNWRAA